MTARKGLDLRPAVFAAAAVVVATISRYGGEATVPFSLMPLVAMLAGGILGSRGGAKSMALYLLLGLAGVPVFAKPPYGGLVYLTSPTFGFLLGFVFQAYVAGKVIESYRGKGRFLLAMLLSVTANYVAGLPYLYVILNFYLQKSVGAWDTVKIGFLPFIAFDAVKAVLAAYLVRGIRSRLPGTEKP